MKKTILMAGVFCAVAGLVQAGVITSTATAPTLGAEDISHLGTADVSSNNVAGTGITLSWHNDASTYVANDRTTQGQTFEMTTAGTVQGVWIKHVGFTDVMENGTWSGLSDGTAIDIRISSVSGTTLSVLGSETATVAAGSGIPGGNDTAPWWGGSDKWLYIALATPVALPTAGTYAFDLTSAGPWFELDGLAAGTYAGGDAYTTAAKNDLDMGTVHTGSDRSFVVDVIPEPGTIGLVGIFGAGVLFVRRHFRN